MTTTQTLFDNTPVLPSLTLAEARLVVVGNLVEVGFGVYAIFQTGGLVSPGAHTLIANGVDNLLAPTISAVSPSLSQPTSAQLWRL